MVYEKEELTATVSDFELERDCECVGKPIDMFVSDIGSDTVSDEVCSICYENRSICPTVSKCNCGQIKDSSLYIF